MSTTRQQIDQLRLAFVSGMRGASSGRWTASRQAAAEKLAAFEFPVPTFERPRLVQGRLFDYKIEGGRLFSRYTGPRPQHFRDTSVWKPVHLTPELLQELLDLYENPTETVEVQ